MSTTENTGFLPIGTQIGEYQITQLLGQGGFGITYKAWDNVLKCDVAIKGRYIAPIGVIAGVLSRVPPVAWLFLIILALLPSKPKLHVSNHNKAV